MSTINSFSALFYVLLVNFLTLSNLYPACTDCFSDPKVIFVNASNTPPGSGDGSYGNPYQNLHTALTPGNSNPCDVIYVFPGTYDTHGLPFLLQEGQRLLSTTLEAFQRCPTACDIPILTNTDMSMGPQMIIVFSTSDNEISGFNIQARPLIIDVCAGLAGDYTSFSKTVVTNNNFVITASQGRSEPNNLGMLLGYFNGGTLELSNCTFELIGSDTTSDYIGSQILGMADVIISNNTYINNSTSRLTSFIGLFTDIIGNLIIKDNVFDFTSIGILDTTFITFPRNIIPRKHILNNTITPSGVGTLIYRVPISIGIVTEKETNDTSAFYVEVSNNTVNANPKSVGYFFEAKGLSSGPLFLDFDNSNVGTFFINPAGEDDPIQNLPIILSTGFQ